jgi:hypothetical protein
VTKQGMETKLWLPFGANTGHSKEKYLHPRAPLGWWGIGDVQEVQVVLLPNIASLLFSLSKSRFHETPQALSSLLVPGLESPAGATNLATEMANE